MVQNFPYPYQVHYRVVTPVGSHKQRVGLNVTSNPAQGTSFTGIDATRRGSTTVDLATWATEYFGFLLGVMGANYSIDTIELWKYAPESLDGTYVSSFTSSFSRTTGDSAEVAKYRMLTFRTSEGGVMKIVLFDKASYGNTQQPYTSLSTEEKALIDHVRSSACALIGLDGSFPIGFIRASDGQNEALWRKAYR